MWEQYLRDLIVFGCNAIELIPPRSDDDADSPHFPLPPLRMMTEMSGLADAYGLEVLIPAGEVVAPELERLGAQVTAGPYESQGMPGSPLGFGAGLRRARSADDAARSLEDVARVLA